MVGQKVALVRSALDLYRIQYDGGSSFIKRGLFNLREDEVRLYRIKDLGLERNLIQRMFGLGTIRVVSSDSSLGNFDPDECEEQFRC